MLVEDGSSTTEMGRSRTQGRVPCGIPFSWRGHGVQSWSPKQTVCVPCVPHSNNVAPSPAIPLMGTIFSHYGYRTAYTGKWHLDGSAYFGDGVPGGGFEPDWWYDGKRYAQEIGPEMFRAYRSCRTADELRAAGFSEEKIWGHRVANRAIDFLDSVGDEPFCLVVSFDEPHGPHVTPPAYWEQFSAEDIPRTAITRSTAHDRFTAVGRAERSSAAARSSPEHSSACASISKSRSPAGH